MMIEVWFSIIAFSLIYCYFIASKIPKGKFRLISLLPIIYLFTILPLYLPSLFFTGLSGLVLTWLANFKLLLFAFDQGPFSSNDPPKSFFHFMCITCLPIKIKQNNTHPFDKNTKLPSKLALSYPTKVVFLVALVCFVDNKDALHPKIVLMIYSSMLYLLLDVVLGVFNFLVRALMGIELESPSDEPYFSTSLQDFWGRRWNLMVTNILRETVYKPVRSRVGNLLLGSQWAPLAAAMGFMAAFLVSGLMHELIFYYITRVTPTWEVTWFFVLHGVCLVVEYGLKRMLIGKLRLHWAVSGPLTVGFVVVTAMWLFFPPVVRPGADVKVVEEWRMFIEFVKSKFKLVLGNFAL